MGEQEMDPPEEEVDKEVRAASLRAESEALARGVVANVDHVRFGRGTEASNAFEGKLRRTAFRDVDDTCPRVFPRASPLCRQRIEFGGSGAFGGKANEEHHVRRSRFCRA